MTLSVSSRRPTAGTRDGARGQHTVRSGDTLSHIAKRNGVGLNDLLKANPQIRNANLIHPGQAVTIPDGGRADTRTISTTGPSTPVARSNGPILSRGDSGPAVSALQQVLQRLGFSPGQIDGQFGPRTQDALRGFQRSQSLIADGALGPTTREALRNPQQPDRIDAPGTNGDVPRLQRYEPNSQQAVQLFREAARRIGVPESWASSAGLHNILRRESNGKVGVPNYTYGARARDPSRWGEVHNELKNGRITARSSATGLGQLLLANVDKYYPSGRAGIGNPVEEAAGMLAYIKDRYGTPDRAWALYGTRHEGY